MEVQARQILGERMSWMNADQRRICLFIIRHPLWPIEQYSIHLRVTERQVVKAYQMLNMDPCTKPKSCIGITLMTGSEYSEVTKALRNIANGFGAKFKQCPESVMWSMIKGDTEITERLRIGDWKNIYDKGQVLEVMR